MPKQLLKYNDNNLLQHAIIEASASSGAKKVITVLGSNSDMLQNELPGKEAEIVINSQWEEGIASSIRCGITYLEKQYPAIDAVILMVCDQPFANTALLNNITVTQQQTGKPIIASKYANNLGTPALFHKSIFPQLLTLKGDKGARKIIQQHPELTQAVLFPEGVTDIDTASDYQNLLNSRK